MRIIYLLLIAGTLFFPINCLKASGDTIHKLENGFKVFFLQKKGTPLLNISVGVEAGAKFDGSMPGTAHLLEHLILFRGGEGGSCKLRTFGADINGHTDNEAVTFEISLPSDRWKFALEFLYSIIYDFQIDAQEFEKEKKILIEEIRQMKDQPLTKARNMVISNVLKGTVYEHPIQGIESGIKRLGYKEMVKWYRKRYVPGASSIVIVGDFHKDQLFEEIKKIYGKLPAVEPEKLNVEAARRIRKRDIKLMYGDVEQGYVVAGFNAPPMNQKGGEEMRAFTGIISKGIYPLMSRAFLNRRRTACSFDTKYVSMINNGIALFEFRFDPEVSNPARVIATLEKFLVQMVKFRFSVKDYPPAQRQGRFDFLKYISNSQKFSRETFREKGLNLARAYSRYIVLKRWYDMAGTSTVKSSGIHKLVRKYMLKGRYFSVAILPEKYRGRK